jgi:hypothetical protein
MAEIYALFSGGDGAVRYVGQTNLFVVTNLPLPSGAIPATAPDDDLPF